MGSTGSGHFEDYPASRKPSDVTERTDTEGGPGAPGGSGGDECSQDVDADLEEIERCAYFVQNNAVPPPGTDVVLLDALQGGRLAVATAAGADVIGFLPTSFNYLVRCIAAGHAYAGEITDSADSPVAFVHVLLQRV